MDLGGTSEPGSEPEAERRAGSGGTLVLELSPLRVVTECGRAADLPRRARARALELARDLASSAPPERRASLRGDPPLLVVAARAGARIVVQLLPVPPGSPEHLEALLVAAGCTPREREVGALALRAAGAGQIARALGISPVTAKVHLGRVYARLGVAGRDELLGLVLGAPGARSPQPVTSLSRPGGRVSCPGERRQAVARGRSSAPLAGARADAAPPAGTVARVGFLLIDPDGALAASSGNASGLVRRLEAGRHDPFALVARLARALARTAAPWATRALPLTGGGWLEVKVTPLPGPRGRELLLALEEVLPGPRERLEAACRAAGLTPRERDVAAAAARGLGLGDVARALGISLGTVKTHMRRIRARTGTRSIAALTAKLLGLRPEG